MTESANATLSNSILASITQSASYWKAVGGVQLVAASVAVIGNTIVGITLLTNRHLRENPNNIMMANLAMADGLFAFVLFFTGYWNTTAGFFPFGELACRFHIVFAVSSSQVSNNVLAAMSVVKFIHVGFPFTSDQMLQPIVIRALVVICWLPPFIWNIGICLFSLGMKQFFPRICYPVYAVFVNFVSMMCFFLVQFVTVVVAMGLILRIVRRHHKLISVLTVGIVAAPNAAAAAEAKSSWKAVRTFVVVVTAFILMQAPLYFATFVQGICQCLPYELVYEYASHPFNMNCVVNVFIYFIMETRYRKAAIQLLSGGRYGQADASLSH